MQDYSSYTVLNGHALEALSRYESMSTVAVSQWPAQQPIAALADSEIHGRQEQGEISGSLMDCLITIGAIMLLLLSSSVLLGFAADRLTQGLVSLMQQETEIVAR